MELKDKHTKLDETLVPTDWVILPLRNLCRSISDGTHTTPRYVANGIPFYSVENITSDDFHDVKYISEIEHAALVQRCRPERGDILMTRITAGILGDTKLLDWDVDASIYVSLALLKLGPHAVPEYIYRYTKSIAFRKDVEKRALVNATPQKINLGEIGDIPIPLPGLREEQEAIAGALSDTDALIESVEQILAKKHQIKQGAMQELLTGKKRLPGFTGKWEERTLSDLFDFSGGLSASREQLRSDGFCYLHYGDIHAATKTFIDVSADRQQIPKLDIKLSKVSPKWLLADGDIVFVDASEDDEGTSRHVVILNEDGIPFISGLHTIVAKSKTEELDHKYKRYCFQTRAVKSQFMFFVVGTKVSGISKNNIKKIRIPVPTVSEQAAIAAILVEMDAEIAALDAKLFKARQLKQGMMQELLTGRIRLIQPSAEVVPFPVKQSANAGTTANHNPQINEAVVLAVLAHRFGSEQFPLGRFRRTKLSYLLHRHAERQVTGFMKKAAGPYSPHTRYGGAEKIALKNGYVRTHKTAKGEGFIAADKIDQAEGYFENWYGLQVLDWLKQFRYKKNEELELLTTVDMAIEDLRRDGRSVTVSAVKRIIHDSPEWKAKLDRATFADTNITAAIESCRQFFPVEE